MVKVRIGFVGVSAYASTGYGRMTREICYRLLEKHEVFNIGQESDVIQWGGRKEYTYEDGKKLTTLAMLNPMGAEGMAIDTLKLYDYKYDINLHIGHWDGWALPFLSKVPVPWLAYVPVDSKMTQKWANFVRGANRIIAYSEFGYNEFNQFYPSSKLAYIPHGVDTNVFKPLPHEKSYMRRKIDEFVYPEIPEDCCLFLFVGANVGDRKKIPLLMKTFAEFVKDHPDAHLMLYTNFHGSFPHGYDLPVYTNMFGLQDNVHTLRLNPIVEQLTDEQMCQVYNAADCYVTNSTAEGFGMPLIESQSCGIPVIAPDNSAQTELVKDTGWLVDNIPDDVYCDIPVYLPTLQENPIPDQRSMLQKMETIYQLWENGELDQHGRNARKFALNYDWDNIMPTWFRLLDQVENEIEMIRLFR